MAIDLGVGAFVLIVALLGLASGFWSQLLRLGALASLFFIAPPVAGAIGGPVGGLMSDDATPKAVEGISLIVAVVGLYLVMSLLIFLILRALRGNRSMSGTNRFMGFVLGAIKASALSYLVLAGLLLVSQSHLAQLDDADFWVENAAESKLVELVSEYNLLTAEEVLEYAEELGIDPADLHLEQLEGTGQALPPPPGVVGPGSGPPMVAPTVPGAGMPPGAPLGPGVYPSTPGSAPVPTPVEPPKPD